MTYRGLLLHRAAPRTARHPPHFAAAVQSLGARPDAPTLLLMAATAAVVAACSGAIELRNRVAVWCDAVDAHLPAAAPRTLALRRIAATPAPSRTAEALALLPFNYR